MRDARHAGMGAPGWAVGADPDCRTDISLKVSLRCLSVVIAWAG